MESIFCLLFIPLLTDGLSLSFSLFRILMEAVYLQSLITFNTFTDSSSITRYVIFGWSKCVDSTLSNHSTRMMFFWDSPLKPFYKLIFYWNSTIRNPNLGSNDWTSGRSFAAEPSRLSKEQLKWSAEINLKKGKWIYWIWLFMRSAIWWSSMMIHHKYRISLDWQQSCKLFFQKKKLVGCTTSKSDDRM